MAVDAAAGQATVELLGATLALLIAGLIAFQLLAAGYAAVMADHAAEAAALALVNGREPRAAAERALPGWPRRALRVQTKGGRAEVTLVPPSPFAFVRERLSFTAEAAARVPATSPEVEADDGNGAPAGRRLRARAATAAAAQPEIELRPRGAPPAGLDVLLLGLTRPCGLSTLARGLAAQLAAPGSGKGM